MATNTYNVIENSVKINRKERICIMKEKINLCYFRIEHIEGLSQETQENILKKDFNFDQEYIINYSKSKLKIGKNEKYIPQFYKLKSGNISDISCIIGKNGIGKTTLLNLLIKALYENKLNRLNAINDSYIVVLKEDNTFKIYAPDGLIKKVEIEEKNEYQLINIMQIHSISNEMNQKFKTLYFSNIVNLRNRQIYCSGKGFFNISLEEDMYKNYGKGAESDFHTKNRIFFKEKFADERFIGERKIQEIKNNVTVRDFNFLAKTNNSRIERICFSPKCYTSWGSEESLLDRLRYFSKHTSAKLYNRIDELDTTMQKIEQNIYEQFEREIYISKNNDSEVALKILQFIVIDKFFEELYNKANDNRIIDMINNELSEKVKQGTAMEMFEQVLKAIQEIDMEIIKEQYDKYDLTNIMKFNIKEVILNYYKEFADKICEKYNKTLKNIERVIYDKNTEIRLYEPDKSSIQQYQILYQIMPIVLIPKEKINVISEILSQDNNFLELFDFELKGLSSGEQSLLSIYSNFFQILHKLDNTDNVLIIMDEPELYFHPEWQRQFIYFIIDFFNRYYIGKNVQIIFTSNSPYVLSDLNQSSVIKLGSAQKNRTFAGNILYLLIDEYFMSDTIGKFSETKIKAIIKRIKKGIILDKDIQVVNQIGEDIIRNNIYEMIKKYSKKELKSRNRKNIRVRKIKAFNINEKENVSLVARYSFSFSFM